MSKLYSTTTTNINNFLSLHNKDTILRFVFWLMISFQVISQSEPSSAINQDPISDNKNLKILECKTSRTALPFITHEDYQFLQYPTTDKIRLSIPIGKDNFNSFQLNEASFFEPNFTIWEESSMGLKKIILEKGQHYQGKTENNKRIALSLFDHNCSGIIYDDQEYHKTIHSVSQREGHGLIIDRLIIQDNENRCSTDDILHYIESDPTLTNRTKEACKRVTISVRTDYELFLRFNKDNQAVVNYVLSLFNQINSIYRNEEIQISLSEIMINISPDGIPHTTANADLNYINNKYRSYKGNVNLTLSGFKRNGKAVLGGVAYINSLCQRTYSYAYANVESGFKLFPEFSYDVFLTAHELGHVLGSRHTHACVWGPNKNQALDNCAKVEGSCLAGPAPVKGSLMSYCHLSGNPGIDLSLGFGKEPGDLIRKTVNSANCLLSYSPLQGVLNSSSVSISANVECSDGLTSHYYFDNYTADEKDDILLASIQKNGQDIGNLKNGTLAIYAHTGLLYGTGKAYDLKVNYSLKNVVPVNRFWEIKSQKTISIPIHVKINYDQNDIKDIKYIHPGISPEKLSCYVISEPGNANPDLKHTGITSAQFKEFKHSTNSGINNWKNIKLNETTYSAEFLLDKLNIDIGMAYLKINGANESTIRSKSDLIIESLQNPLQNNLLRFSAHSVSEINHKISIQIHDLSGKCYINKTILLKEGINEIEIDNLLTGMYIINFKSDTNIHTQHFIKI